MIAPVISVASTRQEFEKIETAVTGIIERPIYPYFGIVQFQGRSWPASFYDSPSPWVTNVGDRVTVVGHKRGILLVSPLTEHCSTALEGNWNDELLEGIGMAIC